MKILGICGTHNKNQPSASEWILQVALDAAKELGAETSMIRLIQYPMKPCASCHLCMCDRACPLFNDPDDKAKEVFAMIEEAQGIILSSPVYSYHQPAIMMNLIQRARFFHEVERGRYFGMKKIRKSFRNPFAGKPIGTLVNSATIGNETALADLMHNLRGLGAAPVACAGICLFDSVIGTMYKNTDSPAIKEKYCTDQPRYQDNACARGLAESVGKWVYQCYQSPGFQNVKHYIKL